MTLNSYEATNCLNMNQFLRVNELFVSIQGESSYSGVPCFFIRLTGCPLRCIWCDTEYAFHEGEQYSIKDLVSKAKESGCKFVEVTGGEPLAQKGTIKLLESLLDENFEVLLETSGAFPIHKVPKRVVKIIDIKCPGSKMSEKNLWENFDKLEEHDEIKCVIADESDYNWAKEELISRNLLNRNKIFFSPVAAQLSPKDLAEWIINDKLPVRIQLQIHKIIWPNRDHGF